MQVNHSVEGSLKSKTESPFIHLFYTSMTIIIFLGNALIYFYREKMARAINTI